MIFRQFYLPWNNWTKFQKEKKKHLTWIDTNWSCFLDFSLLRKKKNPLRVRKHHSGEEFHFFAVKLLLNTRTQWCCGGSLMSDYITEYSFMLTLLMPFVSEIALKWCSDTCEALWSDLKSAVGLWLRFDVETLSQK